MKLKQKLFTAILICLPVVAWSAANNIDDAIKNINATESLSKAREIARDEVTELQNYEKYKTLDLTEMHADITSALADINNATPTDSSAQSGEISEEGQTDTNSDTSSDNKNELQEKIDSAKEKLDQAKETEQSFANRMLGGVTTAAVGLGSMQLAQGLAEKQADSAANKDMNAYIASMYCLIGNDYKSSRVELNEKVNIPQPTREFTNNRSEYLSLANELKTLKSALGLKAGIESEVVVDDLGLYQNTNKGITDGAYASRYRANAQNDADDKKALKDAEKTTKTRMIAGGVVAGAGMLAGMVGNSLINGELGKSIKGDNDDDDVSDNDVFKNVQLANLDQAKRLIEEYEGWDEIDTNSCKKKSNVIINGRTQDTYTCKYKDHKNREGKIKFEFDDLNEKDTKKVRETLREYFCGDKESKETKCNKKVSKVMSGN